MSRHIVIPRRPPGSDPRRATGTGSLLVCLVVLSLAGCGSAHDVAERQVMKVAKQVAHETEPWATDSVKQDGWKSNQAVLDRLVSETRGELLTSVVHNPDEHGVGLLATVEVVMVGQASRLGGPETYYNICVRFEVRRASTGPREIDSAAIECPRGVPATWTPEYE